MVRDHEQTVNADEALADLEPKARKYTILFLIIELRVGGAEKMLLKMLLELNREKFDPIVVTLRPGGELEYEFERFGIQIATAGIRSVSSLIPGLLRLGRLVKRLKPDIVHGWLVHGNLASSMLRMRLPEHAPILWGIRHAALRASDVRFSTYLLTRVLGLISRIPEAIVYNSSSGASGHEIIGYPKSKSVVIPNGFDLARFQPSQRSYELVRTELGLAPNQRIVGLVARYHPMKDHLTFLRAAAIVADHDESVSFVLAGRHVDASNAKVTSAIEELGLAGRVLLLGERTDIPHLTAAMDVAVNSSFSEGFPNSIGEAMASGVVCVVTDVGDSRWLVGDTGMVVPRGDHARLAAACRELLSLSDSERAHKGRRARERIEKHFSIGAVSRQYEQLFLKALAGRRAQ